MRIIAKRTLREYWLTHPPAEFPLLDWYQETSRADWSTPNEVKATYGNASIIANNRVVFNIKGNDYRLITEIDYAFKLVFIIWVGTHAEYDKIDAATVSYKS